ncbi:MAG: cytochrome c oxidase subunit 2A, partial [Ktedonobacteraceae bacterium]
MPALKLVLVLTAFILIRYSAVFVIFIDTYP